MNLRHAFPLLIASLCIGLGGMAGAQSTTTLEDDLRPASDHVLVKISRSSSAASLLSEDSHPLFGGWHRVPVTGTRDVHETAAVLSKSPHVEEVSLDPVVQLDPVHPSKLGSPSAVATPNDPYYSYQWHFAPVQLEEAWKKTTGRSMVVAVVDTGISQGGVDLDCHQLVHPYNAIHGSQGLSAAEDDHGHGTHVAGTIAQCTNNGIGVAGVAIDADLMPVKVLDSIGNGNISQVATGVDWARAHGADVINLSLGGRCESKAWPACSEPILNDAIEAAVAEDIIIVAAAGNEGRGHISHPANHPEVIAVGAVDIDLDLAPYSNRGPALDVVAPGGNTKLDINGDSVVDGVLQEAFTPSGGWAFYAFQGTSMATPHVSAATALLRSAFPDADRTQITDALIETSRDLGSAGIDSTFGSGLIQMSDAVDSLLATDSAAPIWPLGAALSVTETGVARVEVSWPEATDDLGVVAYRLFAYGETVKSVGGDATSTTVSGLTDRQSHSIAVRAFDTAGNQSVPLTAAVGGSEVTARSPRSFVDTADTIFHQDILWLSAHGLTRGCNPPANDRYCPDDPVTRGQMAAFLTRALVLSTTAPTTISFQDADTSVFQTDIQALAGSGITRGCNPPANDRYCPDDPVTRGQMAAFLTRALGLTTVTADAFRDDDTSVFVTDIEALAASGIARGCNPPANDRFCPDEPVTRGQMAAFLARALYR